MGQRTCSVEGCGRPHKARGLCKAHYAKWRYDQLPFAAPGCSADGCERPHYAKGLCGSHYTRLRTTGSVGTEPLRVHGDLATRFWSYVDKTGDCWEWTGGCEQGYGRLKIDGRMVLAHRLSYEMAHGSIDSELTVDHLCYNPPCVNPSHLRLLTLADNSRGVRRIIEQMARTHCPQGHAYDEANTLWYRNGRYCRACHRARGRKH